MPELPDVEIFKQYIDSTSLHKKIDHIEVKDRSILNISPQTLRKHIESQAFEKTERVGKHLFLSTGSEKWLMLHFGMTGNVEYSENSETIPDHTLVLFHFSNEGHLAYICQRKLGAIDITKSPATFSDEHSLGEDALGINLKKFRQLLDKKSGMIKSALMDQSTIAGIGNVYSDEILYQSKIHPETKIDSLSGAQIKQLHRNMKRILKTAINNKAKPEKMPNHYLISHRQKEARCPDCNGTVKRIEISGRGCYICPECQSKP